MTKTRQRKESVQLLSNFLQKSHVYLITIVLIFCTHTTRIFAQEKTISLNIKDAKLELVLGNIERQTSYLFVYSDNIDVGQMVSISAVAKPLRQVLGELLTPLSINYAVNNTSIVLSPAAPKEMESARRVFGRITATNGAPIVGASVVIKGTSIGTTTGADGKFSLEVSSAAANSALVFNYLGYEQIEIPLDGKNTFAVTMKEFVQVVEQVVVTALGIKRSEKALSYNVQSVASDELTTVKDANFMNALSGKVAGLNINASSGGVGSASKVQMRGSRSIMQSSNALYVIDGVPMMNRSNERNDMSANPFGSEGATDLIADINSEDIESVSVLMGSAAAALYGSIAANGAVIINTKRGARDRTTVTVTQNTDFTNAFFTPDFQTRYGTGSPEGNSSYSWGAKLNRFNYIGYEPKQDYLQTGVTTTETVSLSTGNSRNQTYVSAGAVNSEGIIPNSLYDRYNFSLRNTASFLKDKMTLDAGAAYTRQRDLNMTSSGAYANPIVSAYLYPRGNDWNAVQMFERWDDQRLISLPYWDMSAGDYIIQNPYWINYRNLRENKRDHYTFNASLSYDVLKWLKLSARTNFDSAHDRSTKKYYAGTNTQLTESSQNGLYGESSNITRQTYADFMAHINNNWSDGRYSLNATLGTSIHDLYYDAHGIEGPIRDGSIAGEQAMIPNVFNIYSISNIAMKKNAEGYREQTQSVFASAEFGYMSTYFLTATLRTDWPSQLWGPESVRNSFTYPSVGISTVLSQAFKLPKQIDYLKVRGSFARVGLAFSRFLANPKYSINTGGNVWQDATSKPVNDLKPEFTNSLEVGMTARVLKHFNLDVTLYDTHTYDQLLNPQVSVSSGFSTIYVQNGDVRNRGIEASLGYNNKWDKFSWHTNVTFSINRNRIMKLAGTVTNVETGEQVSFTHLPNGGLGGVKFLLTEGGTLGDLYSLKNLMRDSNGNIYVDQNGLVYPTTISDTSTDSWTKLGSVFPKANLGWRNDFGFGNFNMGLLFTARLGGVVYSRTQATLDFYGVSESSAAARDRGGVAINNGDIVSAYNWYNTVAAGDGIPQYYTYDATNVRLAEASLSYTVPRRLLGDFCDMTLSLVGRNLWMIYNRAPFDPESASSVSNNYYQGIDYFMSPSMRNIGFSIRLKF
jgi:TonB-linked SusC/RagA family outer membrane protein